MLVLRDYFISREKKATMFKAILNILVGLIFIVMLLSVTGKLFFEKDFDNFYKQIGVLIFPEAASATRLRVALAADIISFEPTIYESTSRSFMMNIFESLVRTNKYMELMPQLALSWGVLEDDLTWEFILRHDVVFHDGSSFSADDVLASLDRARNFPGSQLKNILANVSIVEKIDDFTVRIKTKSPDAVFPQKISAVLITPSEINDFIKEKSLIGTAAYKFANKSGQKIELRQNIGYWGSLPRYEDVIFEIIKDKFSRLDAMQNRRIDIMMSVPPDNVSDAESFGYDVKIRPGLEANFLFFDLDNSDLAQKSIRNALTYSIDKNLLKDFGSSYISPLHQFVPTGILGHNPEIAEITYNVNYALDEINNANYSGKSLKIVMADRLAVLGNFIRDSFFAIGVNAEIIAIPEAKLMEKFATGDGDLYFVGWRFNFGDIADFLGEVVHSQSVDGDWGKLNFLNYSNSNVDSLIEQSFTQSNIKERSKTLREIMKIIVEEDVIGIPLFSSKIISANLGHVDWEPRLDSYFIASEVK